MTIQLFHAPAGGALRQWTDLMIRREHYLHKMPDPRTSVEVLYVQSNAGTDMGALVFGRPEATRCADWYGGVDDVAAGRCEVTRWQVLCLSRVWLMPCYQVGGASCVPGKVPGFVDRKGHFRSTLATTVMHMAADMVRFEYLTHRPPCFLDEPYELRWLLSYCDTSKHKGTIYKAAGWELYRTNDRGIQTWRTRLPALTAKQDAEVRRLAESNPRSIGYRAKRAQLEMELG